jgi:hypothetical protein
MLIYITIAFFIGSVLSIFYVRYERGKIAKVTDEIKNIFVDLPDNFEHNFLIKSYNKYLLEIFLFFFLVLLLVVINVFICHLFIKSQSNIGENTLYLLLIFMQFFFVGLSGYVGHSLWETFLLFKKYLKITKFNVVVDNCGIYIPFWAFEGIWREIAVECDKNYLFVSFTDISEFIVEPSRGIKRITPPYFKIKIKSHEAYIFVQRNSFKGQERQFIESFQERLPIQITLNDGLR